MMSRRTLIAATAVSLTSRSCAAQADAAAEVHELRHYVTRPGRREDLVAMFEAHFLDAYERAGARIVATWRNLDDPRRWCWIRAFESLEARNGALRGFYTSEVWRQRADACNATLADVGDARLLHPLLAPVAAPDGAASGAPVHELLASQVGPGDVEAVAGLHAAAMLPLLEAHGAQATARWVSADAGPPDPRRPLRAGTWVVTLVRHADAAALARSRRLRPASAAWRAFERQLAPLATVPMERWRLAPTARSALP